MVSITTSQAREEAHAPKGPTWARMIVIAALLTALATAIWFGLADKLSLDELRLQRGGLLAFVHAHPAESLALYILLYTGIVTVSVPGALVMTLSGGFLFGAVEGGAAAVSAVTIGSVLMYLAAHTALGDSLRAWIMGRSALLMRLEAEVKRHPFTNTLTLRLIPAAPIVLVNLAAGFVRIPLLPYALATVIGVIPSTFLYASVGAGLDHLFCTIQPDALMSVIRTELVGPVAGLFGLAAVPLAVRWWTGRRVAQRHAVQ